jgi:hypothetical protein
MLYIIGKTEVSGHQYTEKDIKAVVPLSKYEKNPTGFYGGRFQWVGETNKDGLIMLMVNNGKWKIEDIAVNDLNILGIRDLREMAEGKKYISVTALNKDELVHLIETGEYPRKDKS